MKRQNSIWKKLYREGLIWKKTNKIRVNLRGKSVLELGVGNGKTLKAINSQNPKSIVALDSSKEAIRIAKKSIDYGRVLYITKDFLKYKTNKKFEIIFCYYFLNNFTKKNRIKAIQKMKSLLKKEGIILFEDFGNKDFRKEGIEIEHNTISKKNGLICHFFDKDEIKELFNDCEIEIEEKEFNPIRENKKIKRHIINAVIRTR